MLASEEGEAGLPVGSAWFLRPLGVSMCSPRACSVLPSAGQGGGCWSWPFSGDLGLLGARPFPKLASPRGDRFRVLSVLFPFLCPPHASSFPCSSHPPSLSSSLGWQTLLCGPGDPPVSASTKPLHMPALLRPGWQP